MSALKRRLQTKAREATHVDDWLITYADMITLLLCFFVVLFVCSTSRKDAVHTPTLVQIIDEIKSPTASNAQVENLPPPQIQDPFPDNLPFRKLEASDFTSPEQAVEDGEHMPLTQILPPVVPGDKVAQDEPLPLDVAPPPAGEETQPVVSSVALAPEAKPLGDRITILDIASAAFFDRGSATLSAAGKAYLQPFATKLKADEYKGYLITVEGHTDDMPISTPQFPSNWELSTARASAVVHYLLEQGIAAPKLRAAGYADTFPKLPNRDATGNAIAANQAQNRRVVIKLEKIERN